MRLRRFLMDDYEDVANMLHLFYKEVFSDKRKIGSKYFFYKEVNNWINSRKDIIIAEDKVHILSLLALLVIVLQTKIYLRTTSFVIS